MNVPLNKITRPNSRLTFERKYLEKHPQVCSEDRTYIDFLINGEPLSKLIGDVGNTIGKFGWKDNYNYEIGQLKLLQNHNKSELENGLHSIYVCAECGDEFCGAVMHRVLPKDNIIIWTDFVWSIGYIDSEESPDVIIDIEPLAFDLEEYENALNGLKTLISGE